MVLDFVWRNEAAHIWTVAFRITFLEPCCWFKQEVKGEMWREPCGIKHVTTVALKIRKLLVYYHLETANGKQLLISEWGSWLVQVHIISFCHSVGKQGLPPAPDSHSWGIIISLLLLVPKSHDSVSHYSPWGTDHSWVRGIHPPTSISTEIWNLAENHSSTVWIKHYQMF